MSSDEATGAFKRVERVIRPAAPYSITPHLSLFTLEGRPVPAIYERGRLRVLAYNRGRYTPLNVIIVGEPWEPEIRFYGPEDLVRKMLRTDFDYGKFLESLLEYPELRGLAERHVGLRPTRSLSLYSALLESVVKQRISLKAALRIQSRIILALGEVAHVEGEAYYGHPPPGSLLDPERLRGFGLTKMKAVAISEVARAELEGRLPSLREVEESPKSVIEELQEISGIGPWTAELAVAMISRGFEVGPASDLAVRRGLSRALGVEPEGREVERALRDLREYAGLIMYLASLDYEVSSARSKKGRRSRGQA